MPIDKILVRRKFNFIGQDLLRLKPLSQLGWKKYQEEYENEILAERYLERIIGRMIDVNYHLITELENLPPRDYYQSFIKLGELKIISYELARTLAKFAGLRNRLAHEYNGIEARKIHQAIKNCFKDLPRYMKQIDLFLRKGEN